MSAVSKVTTKGRTTIPRSVRERLALRPGDLIAFEVKGDVVQLRKVEPLDVGYLRAVQSTLSEWESPEDAEASMNFERFDVLVVPFPFVDFGKEQAETGFGSVHVGSSSGPIAIQSWP